MENNNLDEEIFDMGEDGLNCSYCIFKSCSPTGECNGECMTGEDEINDLDDSFEFIWGVVSWDDLSGSEANLYTMNDIDIVRDKESNKYFLEIETIYGFEKEIGKYLYVRDLLKALDKFMDDNGYEKRELGFYETFCGPIEVSNENGFDTIEELYAYHASRFRGYLANFEYFHKDLIDEYNKKKEEA